MQYECPCCSEKLAIKEQERGNCPTCNLGYFWDDFRPSKEAESYSLLYWDKRK